MEIGSLQLDWKVTPRRSGQRATSRNDWRKYTTGTKLQRISETTSQTTSGSLKVSLQRSPLMPYRRENPGIMQLSLFRMRNWEIARYILSPEMSSQNWMPS